MTPFNRAHQRFLCLSCSRSFIHFKIYVLFFVAGLNFYDKLISQTLSPHILSQSEIPITNGGIKLNFLREGHQERIRPGDYVFCGFEIKYRDSILHKSSPNEMDNVVFIPVEYNRNPNHYIYEVFTYLGANDEVIFEIPFRFLPWKDAILKDEDSIRYHLWIDSVFDSDSYHTLYEAYLDKLEANLDHNQPRYILIKETILESVKRAISQKGSWQGQDNGFIMHRNGYWYKMLEKKDLQPGAPKDSLHFKYMICTYANNTLDETYLQPITLKISAWDDSLPPIFRSILNEIQAEEQILSVFVHDQIKSIPLDIPELVDYFIIWFEKL